MTLTSGFVNPDPIANPTVLGKQEVPIAPLSCWAVGVIGSVLTFPTKLDQERLQKAFAKAASYWPVVAGRYVKATVPGTEFAISLTQSPIPFDTQTVDAEYPYADHAVVQDDLGEYVTPLADNFFEAGADAPLVTVRITELKTGSALGVNWSHVLGDAAAFSRFLEDVSIFYNLPYTDLENDEVPTFQPHVRLPKATEQILEQFKIPILTRLPLGEVFKGYSDAVAQSQRFTVTISPDDLAHIAAVRLPGDKVSDNDLVCAWWCSVLERAGQPLDWVVQTINYRNWHKGESAFPRNLSTLSANVAQQRQIHIPARGTIKGAQSTKPGTRVLQIARAIRGGMQALQNDVDLTLGWLANAAHEIGTAAHEGTSFLLVPEASGVVLNSNWRYDWAVKFGQPSAAYHTAGSFPRILRVFRANPVEGQSDEQRAIELAFRVPVGPGVEAVQKVIDDERARWKAEGPVHEHEDEDEGPEVKSFNMHSTVAREPWGGYGH